MKKFSILLSLVVSLWCAQVAVGTEYEYSIQAAGFASGANTAADAILMAELDYYTTANYSISIAPAGHNHLSTELPQVNVFANPDGTYDAESLGNVHYETDDWFSAWGWWWPSLTPDGRTDF